MGISIANTALRAASGAFILNSGLGKLKLDEAGAAGLQQLAANGVPQLAELDPKVFGKLLSVGEIALGGALLLPLVPSRLAGLGLGAFSAALVASYLRTPGMTEADGLRPSADGTALAKDVWLAAIAVALVFGRQSHKKDSKAKKSKKK